MPERPGALLRRRVHAERQLVHSALVRRYAETPSPLEGERPIQTYADHLIDVPCYYYTVGGGGQSQGQAQGEYQAILTMRRAKVQFPYGTDIGEQDVIQLIQDEFGAPKNAQPLQVNAVADLHTHIEVEAAELR